MYNAIKLITEWQRWVMNGPKATPTLSPLWAPSADIRRQDRHVAFVPILLQKSVEVCAEP
jgi:hypothetical protein